MKTGIALLAGLLVAETVAGGVRVEVAGCKAEKTVEVDTFSCPCSGGSGDYDIHYTELPEDWKSDDRGKITIPKGKLEDKKAYGAKVEIIDKRTKESVKRSLFFKLENGKVKQAIDHDFDFDVDQLVPGKSQNSGQVGNNVSYSGGKIVNIASNVLNSQNSQKTEEIKRLFDGVDGIGGGCGLAKLRPFLLGNGLYKGDDKNPFIYRLPADADVDKVVDAGTAKDIKDVIVFAARSKVGCQEIGNFLDRFLKKIRNKVSNNKIGLD